MPYNAPTTQYARQKLLELAEKLDEAAKIADVLPHQPAILGKVEDALQLTVEAYLHGQPPEKVQAVFDHLATGATVRESISQVLEPAERPDLLGALQASFDRARRSKEAATVAEAHPLRTVQTATSSPLTLTSPRPAAPLRGRGGR